MISLPFTLPVHVIQIAKQSKVYIFSIKLLLPTPPTLLILCGKDIPVAVATGIKPFTSMYSRYVAAGCYISSSLIPLIVIFKNQSLSYAGSKIDSIWITAFCVSSIRSPRTGKSLYVSK